MKLSLIFTFIIITSITFSQEYSVANIPPHLLNNANAVLRLEETKIKVKSIDNIIVKNKYVVTILNENGDKYANYHNSYSNLKSLTDISGQLLDAEGKLIKKIHKREINDVTASNEYELITDERVKHFSFSYKLYPYTVVFEEEEVYKTLLFIPSWYPFNGFNFAVQESNYIFESPASLIVRFKAINNAPSPTIVSSKDSIITYRWQLSNSAAINSEKFCPNGEDIFPFVLIAPSNFSFGEYKGALSSWDSFGKFQAKLNFDRNKLPDDIKHQVHILTDTLKTIQQKVYCLYKYLQDNTRYVSIQIGIGGWQPLPASFVSKNKYGDCKALSNFMVSLLKEAGINANYVLVYGGYNERKLFTDFPKDRFNHAISCIPLQNDTIWLECTSQTSSPGYLGAFTGDRKALLVTENGGVIVNTPIYNRRLNTQTRLVQGEIDVNGNLHATVLGTYKALNQDKFHELLNYYSEKERKNYLNEYLDIATYKVENVSYKEEKNKIPVINEKLEITSEGFANVTSKRIFFTPFFFHKTNQLPAYSPRKLDIHLYNSSTDIDTIRFIIPMGYTLENEPNNIKLNTQFGSYTYSVKQTNSTIEIVRIYTQENGIFPAKDYDALSNFYSQMAIGDNTKIILVKNQN